MGIISSAINARSQRAANKANLQMNRDTNYVNWRINQANLDQSKAMFERELAYNYEMWNKQNAYNDPSAQVQRLKGAGLNPYLMLDGGDAGTAGSSTAPSYNQPSMIPMQSGHVDPVKVDFDPIGTAVGIASTVAGLKTSSAQIDKLNAEASIAWEDANYKRTSNMMDFFERLEDMRNVNADTKGKILDNFFAGETMNSRIRRAEQDVDFMDEQINLMKVNRQMEEAKLPFVTQECQARLDNIIQDTALKYQKTVSESTNRAYTRKLIEKADQEIQESIARALMTNKQAFNIPMLTQKQADEMSKLYFEAKKEELEGSKWDSWSKELDWTNKAIDTQFNESIGPGGKWIMGIFGNKF